MVRPITPDRLLEAARASLKSVEYCFLITLSKTGEPHARLVQPFGPEEDLSLWVGTWEKSRKVQEIVRDSRLSLAFYDEKDTAYVTLLGSAHIESDVEKRKKYWRDEWIGFLPEGPEGDDYVLIKCVPDRIEMMSFGRGILPKPYGLRPAVLVRSADSWVVAATA
jgi:general stress protein 26